MRIVLFDLYIDGHHLSYASFIIRYLLEKGHSLAFVTLKPDSRITLLIDKHPGLIVEYVGNAQSIERRDTLGKYFQILRGLQKCFKFADKYKADIVHLLFMDTCDIPTYFLKYHLHGRTWRLFGTWFWLPFIDMEKDDLTIRIKIYWKIRSTVFRRMLEDNVFNGFFIHIEHIKESILHHYRWSEHMVERIIVIPDPVEVPEFSCSQEEARRKLELPLDVPIILYFGGLSRYKGPDVLFSAIKNVSQKFALVVAGPQDSFTQDDVNHWKKDVSSSVQVIDRIRFIPENEKLYYFISADGVILPYHKSFKSTSGIIQHAAGTGKPVIVHDVGEIGRIVKEFSLGIVVNPDSSSLLSKAIEDFLTHQNEITEQVIPNAIRYAELHHWRVMASRVEAAYLTQRSSGVC